MLESNIIINFRMYSQGKHPQTQFPTLHTLQF
jgi:hypothetical protein